MSVVEEQLKIAAEILEWEINGDTMRTRSRRARSGPEAGREARGTDSSTVSPPGNLSPGRRRPFGISDFKSQISDSIWDL